VRPETKKFQEEVIRGIIKIIRAWQDWLRAQPNEPERQEPR
jgi:hypothetical protein